MSSRRSSASRARDAPSSRSLRGRSHSVDRRENRPSRPSSVSPKRSLSAIRGKKGKGKGGKLYSPVLGSSSMKGKKGSGKKGWKKGMLKGKGKGKGSKAKLFNSDAEEDDYNYTNDNDYEGEEDESSKTRKVLRFQEKDTPSFFEDYSDDNYDDEDFDDMSVENASDEAMDKLLKMYERAPRGSSKRKKIHRLLEVERYWKDIQKRYNEGMTKSLWGVPPATLVLADWPNPNIDYSRGTELHGFAKVKTNESRGYKTRELGICGNRLRYANGDQFHRDIYFTPATRVTRDIGEGPFALKIEPGNGEVIRFDCMNFRNLKKWLNAFLKLEEKYRDLPEETDDNSRNVENSHLQEDDGPSLAERLCGAATTSYTTTTTSPSTSNNTYTYSAVGAPYNYTATNTRTVPAAAPGTPTTTVYRVMAPPPSSSSPPVTTTYRLAPTTGVAQPTTKKYIVQSPTVYTTTQSPNTTTRYVTTTPRYL